jgi:large subunit ribosomal protein L25
MQQSKSLTVELREQQGKGAARKIRAAGKIPGVLYGAGEKSSSVAFDHHSFELLVRAGGHHGLLDLNFETGNTPMKALVREIQVHPVSRDFVHVDLQRVSMTEKLRISVQIVLQGKPEGVKTHGGILEHNLRSVDIECLPADIPARIEMDVSQMMIGQALHLSDVKLPGVTVLGHPETAIATVSLPAAERATEVAATETEVAAAPAEGEAKAAGAKPGEAKAAAGAKAAPGKAAAAKPAAAKPAAAKAAPAKPAAGKGKK